MKFSRLIFLSFFLVFTLFSFSFVLAVEGFGYDDSTLPKLNPEPFARTRPINYSLVQVVNDSLYWAGNAWDINRWLLRDGSNFGFDSDFLSYTNPNFDFNELKLNNTIKDLTKTTYFNASVIELITGTDEGSIIEINSYNNFAYNVSEDASDLELRINFSVGVDGDFNQLIIRYRSEEENEPHRIQVQIYEPEGASWENYGDLPENDEYSVVEFGVFDSDEHVNVLGIVQVRLYQDEGAPPKTHKHLFDWVTIAKGFGTPSGEEVDPEFNSWLENPKFMNNVNGTNVNSTWDWINGKANFTNAYNKTQVDNNLSLYVKDNTDGEYNISIDTSYDITTTASVTAGNLDVDDINLNGQVIKVGSGAQSLELKIASATATIIGHGNMGLVLFAQDNDRIILGSNKITGKFDLQFSIFGGNPVITYVSELFSPPDWTGTGIPHFDIVEEFRIVADNKNFKFGVTDTDFQLSSDGQYGKLTARDGIKIDTPYINISSPFVSIGTSGDTSNTTELRVHGNVSAYNFIDLTEGDLRSDDEALQSIISYNSYTDLSSGQVKINDSGLSNFVKTQVPIYEEVYSHTDYWNITTEYFDEEKNLTLENITFYETDMYNLTITGYQDGRSLSNSITEIWGAIKSLFNKDVELENRIESLESSLCSLGELEYC